MGNQSTKAGVITWGNTEFGQLGLGPNDQTEKSVGPRLVESLRTLDVKSVVCGGHHTLAITESDLYSWGIGRNGELGHGDTLDLPSPKLIRAFKSISIKQVACAEHHTAAVSETGILYTWGKGSNGRLGHGCSENETTPKPVESLFGQHVEFIACGDFHTACVATTPSIRVYTWGLGLNGRLGQGDEHDRKVPIPIQEFEQNGVFDHSSNKNQQIGSIGGKIPGSIASTSSVSGNSKNVGNTKSSATTSTSSGGMNHAMMMTGSTTGKSSSTSTLGASSGSSQKKQDEIKSSSSGSQKKQDEKNATNSSVYRLTLGGHHTGLWTTDSVGSVYTWGGGAFGKLGHGNKQSYLSPALLQALVATKIVQLSFGTHHSIGLNSNGQVFTWGQAGRLGHASHEVDEVIPRLVDGLQHVFVVQIAAGHNHCVVVTDTSNVWSWGINKTFSHTDSQSPPNMPTMIKVLSGKAVVSVSCGISHTVALSDHRKLAARARNVAEAAGLDTTDVLLKSKNNVLKNSADSSKSGALKNSHGALKNSSHGGDNATQSDKSNGLNTTASKSDIVPRVTGSKSDEILLKELLIGCGLLDHDIIDDVIKSSGNKSGSSALKMLQNKSLTSSLNEYVNKKVPTDFSDFSLLKDFSQTEEGGGGGLGGGAGGSTLVVPGSASNQQQQEVVVAFLSNELKVYQNLALRLTKQLEDAYSTVNSLQSENSFLKSELEVSHQSNQNQNWSALRKHYEERLLEMERRYNIERNHNIERNMRKRERRRAITKSGESQTQMQQSNFQSQQHQMQQQQMSQQLRQEQQIVRSQLDLKSGGSLMSNVAVNSQQKHIGISNLQQETLKKPNGSSSTSAAASGGANNGSSGLLNGSSNVMQNSNAKFGTPGLDFEPSKKEKDFLDDIFSSKK